MWFHHANLAMLHAFLWGHLAAHTSPSGRPPRPPNLPPHPCRPACPSCSYAALGGSLLDDVVQLPSLEQLRAHLRSMRDS